MSVWRWVGVVLLTYGAIITLMGIYFIFFPDKTKALWELNPSLWWGALMTFFGLTFLLKSSNSK